MSHTLLSAHNLFTLDAIRQMEAAAVATGTSLQTLMERAGQAVVDFIQSQYAPQNVLVLCGPGNNGGDGYVVATKLAAAGWPIKVWQPMGPARTSLAQQAAMELPASCLIPATIPQTKIASWLERTKPIVIDATLGIGGEPERQLPAHLLALHATIAQLQLPVIAVDGPSGMAAETGQVAIGTLQCRATITMLGAKVGLFLQPAAALAGEVWVASLGQEASSDFAARLNGPKIWENSLPLLATDTHKYLRGKMLVLGGENMTGAAILAARAAQRAGAGLVQLAMPAAARALYAQAPLSVVPCPWEHPDELTKILAEPRLQSIVIGPGLGQSPVAETQLAAVLARQLPTVLDADALRLLANSPARWPQIHPACVLTPHGGEFATLAAALNLSANNKLTATQQMAVRLGCVVVHKGADTVVAAPNEIPVINHAAPAWLATAGSGDVLAGLIGGLLAQRTQPFAAACAAVWRHGELARQHSPHAGNTMIAEDLLETTG